MESPEVACALAAQFNQDAYFWIAKGRIYLGSAAGGPLHRAGSWAARQATWDSPSLFQPPSHRRANER